MSTPTKGELGGDLSEALRQLLRRYHDIDQTPQPLAGLRWYKNLRSQGLGEADSLRALLDEGLHILTERDLPSADLLRERFKEGLKAEYVANRLGVAPATLFEWQNSAINKLGKTVLQREAEECLRHVHNLRQRVPITNTDHLVGIDGHIQALAALLTKGDKPWLAAVTGIGGIGKSTLIGATALHTIMADAWDDIAWVAARTSFLDHGSGMPVDEPRLSAEALLEQLFDQLLPGQPKPGSFTDSKALFQLSASCQHRRCLIVVDNLESVAAAEQLLPALRRLVKPSKVLLGIREKPYMEVDVADYAVPELGEADAIALLRASTGQLLDPNSLSNDALRLVYEIAGGNPQALRVVAGQLVSFGLEDVLADLRDVRSRRIELLYDHIYGRAWEGLTASERHVLLAMAAIDAGGESLSYIIQLADLNERSVFDAMETLIVRNLVERRLSVPARYTIHNLTRTFLYRQIVDWGDIGPSGA